MICDICNAHVEKADSTILPSVEAISLMKAGFGIDEVNIEMLTSAGMPRKEAIGMLQDSYLQSQSDWLLCPKCAADASQF